MSSVQSLDRAFSLLSAVAQQPRGLTDLARATSLPLSTVSRLLGSLEQLGAVQRDEASALYSIGPGIAELAGSIDSQSSLSARLHGDLLALTERVSETAGLSIPSGYEMHYLDQTDSDQPIQVQDWSGTRLPMHLVSAGLVTLASWPSEAVDTYLDRTLEGPTAASVTEANLIRKHLDQIRDAGLAWTVDTLVEGLTSVAAPLVNNNGELVAAIHVHGPSYRFPGKKKAYVEQALLETAAEISLSLVGS